MVNFTTIHNVTFFKAWWFLYVKPGLTLNNSIAYSLWVECFVRISEQTAIFFITVLESVYSAVRTDTL
jgi:hypothetical protein